MSDHTVKKPCKHCPFRRDVKPFLHPERGEELAYLTENPYNFFTCHKTIDYDYLNGCKDQQDIEPKECAGFVTMQIIANGDRCKPEGFTPSFDLVYRDKYEMIDAYENQD